MEAINNKLYSKQFQYIYIYMIVLLCCPVMNAPKQGSPCPRSFHKADAQGKKSAGLGTASIAKHYLDNA